MTVDEVIEHCKRQVAQCEIFGRTESKHYEEHKLVAEWLEELKVLRSCVNSSAYRDGYNRALYEFSENLKSRLTDAIYQKDVESMTNLINEIAKEMWKEKE